MSELTYTVWGLKEEMKMRADKIRRLRSKGWKVGSVAEFLRLTPEEERLIELRLILRDNILAMRKAKHMSQADLAKKIGSSQSRIAKVEAGDPSVSLDLLMTSYLGLGANLKHLAEVLEKHSRSKRRVRERGKVPA